MVLEKYWRVVDVYFYGNNILYHNESFSYCLSYYTNFLDGDKCKHYIKDKTDLISHLRMIKARRRDYYSIPQKEVYRLEGLVKNHV